MLSPRQAQSRVRIGRLLERRAPGDHGPGALGAARARVLHGLAVPARVSRRRVRHAPRLVESLRTDGGQGRARRGRQWRAPRGGCGGFHRRVAAPGRQALGPAGWASRITGWFTTRERRLGWKNLEGDLWAVIWRRRAAKGGEGRRR